MSFRSFLPSRKLARDKILARAPGTQVEEVATPEVRVKKMTPNIKVEDITAEAEAIAQHLDGVVAKIRAWQDPGLVEHLSELDKIQKLLHKVQYQEDMQTSSVADALIPLKAATTRLSEAAPDAPWRFGNAVDEVIQAAKNLQQLLPGDISLVEMNEAENAVQVNAPIGGDCSGRRTISEVLKNKAKNASQINAIMYGDPASLARFMEACKGRTDGGYGC